MTIKYLKFQRAQIALQAKTDPTGANERLEELKSSLEQYIAFYALPEMWANELRKQLE